MGRCPAVPGLNRLINALRHITFSWCLYALQTRQAHRYSGGRGTRSQGMLVFPCILEGMIPRHAGIPVRSGGLLTELSRHQT